MVFAIANGASPGGQLSGYDRPDWDEIFLNAAFEPTRWPDSLRQMAHSLGSAHGQLIAIGSEREVPFNLVSDFDTANIARFMDNGGVSPRYNFRVAATQDTIERGHYDSVLHEGHYDRVVESLADRRYLDWCAEIDIPHGCQTNLVIDRNGMIGFAILRTAKEGRTHPRVHRAFARIARSARRAVRLQERLESQQAQILSGAFDTIGITAFIIDTGGAVMAMTRSAEELLSAGDIRLAGGKLDAAGSPFSLRTGIRFLQAEPEMPTFRMKVATPDLRPPLMLEGFRLPLRPWAFSKVPYAIITANAPQRDRCGLQQFLSLLYGLTPAESDIAMRLFEGKSRALIAQERGVTAETLRGQIKAVQMKMGTEGEAAMMRLMAAIMA